MKLKLIDGYGEKYYISSGGKVYKKSKNGVLTELKGHTSKNGYKIQSITYKGKLNRLRVHRLVAQAFMENPLNHPVVNHIDGNKLNNSIGNLEWCTRAYNTRHAWDNRLMPIRITKEVVDRVMELSEIGELTSKEIGDVVGICSSSVRSIYSGRINKRRKVDIY